MVFDDGERLESFAEADAVGNDATAEAGEFVNRADDAVALKLEKFFPDDGVADAGSGFDNLFFVQRVAEVFEQMIKNQVVGERGGFVFGDGGQLCQQILFGGGRRRQALPQFREPRLQRGAFVRGFRTLNQAQRIARRESKAVGGEGAMPGDGAAQRGIGRNQAGLRERGLRVADFDAIGNPAGALAGEPAGGKLIAKRPVGIRAEKLQVGRRAVG